jgi:hypothetical protein
MLESSMWTTKRVSPRAVTSRKGDESVDSKQFDELVARLASGQSRRNALKGIAGGALATVGVNSVVSAQGKKKGRLKAQGKKGRVGAEDCLAIGSKCPRRQHGKKHTCLGNPRKGIPGCCTRHFEVDADGKKRCACVEDGDPCEKNRNCCSQNCTGGVCVGYGGGAG